MTKKTEKKQPLQKRSQETVKVILDASTRILSREGFQKLNTNRISEVAGVGIGSIYQFFKNKESILSELFIQALDRNLEHFLAEMEKVPPENRDLKPIITALIDSVFENFEKRGFIASAILEHAPGIIGLKRFHKIDEKVIPVVLEKLEKAKLKLRPDDTVTALQVVMNSVRGVVSLTYVKNSSPEEKARVKRELIDMAVRYLTND